MQLREGIRVAFDSLWAYKLRTFLTVLGNIVAVSSVIAVVSLIAGMDLFVRREIADEGSNVLSVMRVDPWQVLTDFDAFLASLHNPNVTTRDYEWLREQDLPAVSQLAATDRETAVVAWAGRTVRGVPVEGWTAQYPFFQNRKLRAGRHFNEFEDRNSRAVAVIGSEIAEKILRTPNPVGRTILVNGRHVEVIGVYEEKKGVLGMDPNRLVVMPLGRHLKLFGGDRSLEVRVLVSDISHVDEVRSDLQSLMRIRRRLGPADDANFAVSSSDTIVGVWKGISSAIFGALVALVSISLVIGGIVIMNIMLVSVTERTREVGTRKALGARRSDILWQFLVESITLSLVGGVIGIALGFLLAVIVAWKSPLPYSIEPWSIAAGLAVTVAVGVFFGLYPANRAAGLDPVEALRRE
ncbi:MAG: ABC transporter permease [bacterium]